jgi:hypothetical protein
VAGKRLALRRGGVLDRFPDLVSRGNPRLLKSPQLGAVSVEEATGWPVAGGQRVADDRLGTLLDGLRASMIVEVGSSVATVSVAAATDASSVTSSATNLAPSVSAASWPRASSRAPIQT